MKDRLTETSDWNNKKFRGFRFCIPKEFEDQIKKPGNQSHKLFITGRVHTTQEIITITITIIIITIIIIIIIIIITFSALFQVQLKLE